MLYMVRADTTKDNFWQEMGENDSLLVGAKERCEDKVTECAEPSSG